MFAKLIASNNVRITCGIRTWKNKVVAKLKIAPFKRSTFEEVAKYKVNTVFRFGIGQVFPGRWWW